MSFILGLTGSIGMGKSATAAMFRGRGVPVHDADATVHALYAGAAVAPVEAAFPGVTAAGRIDRDRLAARVVGDAVAMRRLEAIVHPLVRTAEAAFLAAHQAAPLVVLDIPLLFETGGERRCHAVAVVSAPAAVQRARVLARPGMTAERFERLLARQLPDAEKRCRAHAVIDTSRGFAAAQAQVDDLVRALAGRAPPPLPRGAEAA
ncbi:dephospho-CoA kinase [Labrys wisconsinensis]|uniref:Dephospho-CoA kinase n=1 Tax=Labrys wisconsinensis TaxID=425677 RepID=A0ABU0J1E5_9HYPH|nr:dephospho-CoA kinase [Labrys wisconsinensis]MDQ0468066.1 dephospho-CoA kinase [Labrys wisconsinensis]